MPASEWLASQFRPEVKGTPLQFRRSFPKMTGTVSNQLREPLITRPGPVIWFVGHYAYAGMLPGDAHIADG